MEQTCAVDCSNESFWHADNVMGPHLFKYSPLQITFQNLYVYSIWTHPTIHGQ